MRYYDAERIVFADELLPVASSLNYLGIIIDNDLILADHGNYALRKVWKALHFIMRLLKNGNNNTKNLAYTALVRAVVECGTVCWDHTE
jgi:hypothetical protein